MPFFFLALLKMCHISISPKVGLMAQAFVKGGVVKGAGGLGHQMLQSTTHFAGKMAHTAKGMEMVAETGFKPVAGFFQKKGFDAVFETFTAGAMVATHYAVNQSK
ncbi:MAG: hypothetical protein PW734_11400 [Verrucomicrobium sp.]|nr:hypothetical protein [Verrucomicrobium sp.]